MPGAAPLRIPAGGDPAGTLAEAQLEGLTWTVRHAYEGSAFYRKKLDGARVRPEDIRCLEDLARLPFTTAQELDGGYPLPLRCVPREDLVRVHSSSGTTGKRKILCYTSRDLEEWTRHLARCLEVAGVGRGDTAQIAVGFGLWTAGSGFEAACAAVGALAIPAGPGNVEMQCRLLVDLEATVLCCTPSMALLLAEEVSRRNLRERLRLRTVIQGGDRCGELTRRRIQSLLGVEHVHDLTGFTELSGPGAGIECRAHRGIHYWSDWYLLEVLHPETLRPVPEGELGEMVVTTLTKEASPLLRYRTRDLTRLLPGPCPCGSPWPRHDRIAGRDDDLFVYRAVGIYPSQLEEILAQSRGVSSEYQVVLERRYGKDLMTIRVERDPAGSPLRDEAVEAEIAHRVKSQVLVSAEVEVVDYATLPRSTGRAQRVFDRR
jgi:phenylacetate-CoA ligase